MKTFNMLGSFMLMILAHSASVHAQAPREQLNQMVEQLQKTPSDTALREKIIKLGTEIKPAPAIPEEANRAFVKGGVFQKEAKDASAYEMAIAAYREALRIAPWWADAYFNLAAAQEAAGNLVEATASTKLYLAAVPAGSADAREAQNKLYALEAKGEMAAKSAAKTAAETRAKQTTQIVPGQRIGSLMVGMTPGKLREIAGDPSDTFKIGQWWTNYTWNEGLRASVKMSLDAVDSLQVFGAATQFRTAEGLAVGSPESDIRSKLGPPDRSGRVKNEGGNLYCYRSGLRLYAREGRVSYIEVFRPGGFDQTYCEARFFE